MKWVSLHPWAAAAFGLVALLHPGFPTARAAGQPNFILLITDDISWNDLGCYGNEFVKTPHLDRMAAEGRIFDRAYLTTSSCSPTRCSLITGRYPHNTGAPELHTELPEGQFVFPDALKKAERYRLLQERKLSVEYEPQPSLPSRCPDFAVKTTNSSSQSQENIEFHRRSS